MNKKLLLATITIFLLFVGCGKVTPTNTVLQNEQSTLVEASTNSTDWEPIETKTTATAATNTISDEIDYNQYIKKTWVTKKGSDMHASFSISKIENGEITGRFSPDIPAAPPYDFGHLTGTINNGTAECQFSDETGNKGNIQLVFKPNNEIEAAIKLTEKSKNTEQIPQEGTFLFIPYNLNDIEEVSVIKDQSFTVDLNSWGEVKFVSAKLTGGIHAPPVEFYLTNAAGDILFEFEPDLPYGLDVEGVTFKDVNKDGLKDIIIILTDNYSGSGEHISTVYLQRSDGLFTKDDDLDQEINDSGNNKDIKTVENYLSKKF